MVAGDFDLLNDESSLKATFGPGIEIVVGLTD